MVWYTRKMFDLFKAVINPVLALRWNNTWHKATVMQVFNAKSGVKCNVKDIFKCVSSTVESKMKETVTQLVKTCKNDDEKARTIWFWVSENVKYAMDKQTHLTEDYWQTADETWSRKTGDCECGSILMLKLMQLAGIPAFRRKLCVGNVKVGNTLVGHAYPLYLRESFNEWFCLDWCVENGTSEIKWLFGIKHELSPDSYIDIWFTTNEVYSWCSKDLTVNLGFEEVE